MYLFKWHNLFIWYLIFPCLDYSLITSNIYGNIQISNILVYVLLDSIPKTEKKNFKKHDKNNLIKILFINWCNIYKRIIFRHTTSSKCFVFWLYMKILFFFWSYLHHQMFCHLDIYEDLLYFFNQRYKFQCGLKNLLSLKFVFGPTNNRRHVYSNIVLSFI